MDDQPRSATATWTSRLAHDLRGRVGVLVTGSALVDDPDLARDLGDAASLVRRDVERLVVLARCELDEPPRSTSVDLAGAVERAMRRAVAEGVDASLVSIQPSTVQGDAAMSVDAPWAWGERLIVEVVHAVAAAGCSIDVTVEAAGASSWRITVNGTRCAEATATSGSDELGQLLVDRLAAEMDWHVNYTRTSDGETVVISAGEE